jgi:hypothetical protein
MPHLSRSIFTSWYFCMAMPFSPDSSSPLGTPDHAPSLRIHLHLQVLLATPLLSRLFFTSMQVLLATGTFSGFIFPSRYFWSRLLSQASSAPPGIPGVYSGHAFSQRILIDLQVLLATPSQKDSSSSPSTGTPSHPGST